MRFGILQRYVMGEVFRAFALAVVTMTAVFVLFMVMTEATRIGLGPWDIAKLVPYVVPGSLPYTIPVSLLFAVSVVYGRLAGDNEIIAVKATGQSVWIVLWPSLTLGLMIGTGLMFASAEAIPNSNAMAKRVILGNTEDLFYKYLKKDLRFDNAKWPFSIVVRDVQDRVMIGPTFKKRADKNKKKDQRKKDEDDSPYDMIVQASKATLHFDFAKKLATVYFENATISYGGEDGNEGVLNDFQYEIPMPEGTELNPQKKIQEKTNSEMRELNRQYAYLLKNEQKKQSIIVSLGLASGMVERVNWPQFQAAFVDYHEWKSKTQEHNTEMNLRMAMSWGSFFFVLLGAPVGILFAKRDFLSAFISCFLPIIILYYPLMLMGVNLGKENIVSPVYALWSGNVLLFVLAVVFALPPVVRR